MMRFDTLRSVCERTTLLCQTVKNGYCRPDFVRNSRIFTKCYCRTSSTSAIFKAKPLDGFVDIKSSEFAKNVEHFKRCESRFLEVLTAATDGGSERDKIRHVERNKKLLVKDRLELLFDKYSDTLEVAPLAGMGMSYGDVPRAGIVTAIGRINGVYCMVGANDATIKAGTMYPISVKKQLRSLEVALQNNLPFIFVVDSGGAFLPLQAEIFPDYYHGGRTFYLEAIFNAKAIPTVAVVCGSCTAGAAYVPTMAQEAVIVHEIGTIFLAGPPLVKAALGEVVTQEELGGGRMHSSVSGCTDHLAANETEAFTLTRDIVTSFNIDPVTQIRGDDPLFSVNDLPGLIPSDPRISMDAKKVISRIVDGSRFHEFKAIYGAAMVTGFATVEGQLVGLVAANGQLCGRDLDKASQFVQLCNARDIPLVFLHNSPWSPVHAPLQGEEQGNLVRRHAQLMTCVATATVPKITVVIGNSFGIDNFLLAGRGFDSNFVFTWPNACIAIADADTYLSQLRQQVDEGLVSADAVDGLMKQHQVTSGALHASGQLWDDGVIRPQDTRKVLGQCLQIFAQSRQVRLHQQSRPTNQLISPLLRM